MDYEEAMIQAVVDSREAMSRLEDWTDGCYEYNVGVMPCPNYEIADFEGGC